LQVRLFSVEIGDADYEPLLGQVRADEALLRQMELDAESVLDEQPGKVWCIAAVLETPPGRILAQWTPAAWAAAVIVKDVDGPRLVCCNSYEVPRLRDQGLYGLAYAYRHATVVIPAGLPAVTWVYDPPMTRHQADGWRIADMGTSHIATPDGSGKTEHEWYRMQWTPGN
jgi:hypothetical protein